MEQNIEKLSKPQPVNAQQPNPEEEFVRGISGLSLLDTCYMDYITGVLKSFQTQKGLLCGFTAFSLLCLVGMFWDGLRNLFIAGSLFGGACDIFAGFTALKTYCVIKNFSLPRWLLPYAVPLQTESAAHNRAIRRLRTLVQAQYDLGRESDQDFQQNIALLTGDLRDRKRRLQMCLKVFETLRGLPEKEVDELAAYVFSDGDRQIYGDICRNFSAMFNGLLESQGLPQPTEPEGALPTAYKEVKC